MKRVLILGAPFGTGNLGVDALAGGALAVILRRFPGAEVSMLDYGHAPVVTPAHVGGREIEVPLIDLRFSWKPWLRNNIIRLLLVALVSRLLGRRGHAWVMRRNPWLARIAQADAAAAISGGDSFSDIYGMGRLWYVALPQLLALAVGVPLVVMPQTIGPFRRPMARRVAAFLLRHASRLHVRDQAGVAAVRDLVGAAAPTAAAFCPDLAFVLEPRRPLRADAIALVTPTRTAEGARRPLLGLNVSGLMMIGGYTGRNDFGLASDPRALVERLVEWAIGEADADVLLVPHVTAGAESDVRAADDLVASLAGRHGDRLRNAGGGLAADEAKWLIAHCDLLVGARMHACIGALSQGVPAVGLAYSDKFAGVFASVGASALVADQRRLSTLETLALVQRAFHDRHDLAAALEEVLPAVRSQVLALLDDLPAPHAVEQSLPVPAVLPTTPIR